MQITFRQGIIKAPANFIQLVGNSVNLVIAQPEYLLATVADETATYLFSEKLSVTAAWAGPFTPGTSYWLFWDIHPLTGAKTYGHTLLAPTEGPTAPVTPVNDQHWFDTTSYTMKVWNSTAGRWVNRIRVFAAALSGGSVLSSVSSSAPAFTGTQLSSVAPTLVDVGFIVFDSTSSPLRKGTNKFFTTSDSASTGVVSSSRIKIGNILQEAEALANMPAYTVVTFLGFNQIGNANANTPLTSLFGMIEESVITGQITSVTTSGVVSSDAWDWTGAGINASLYVRDGGVLSTSPAYTGQDAIARVIGKTSIHFGAARVSASYVNDLTSRVAKTGDTMTGALILSANPVVALGAATKQYVDAAGDPNFRTLATNNTASGVSALAANTSGYDNTASGYQSMYSNTTGYDNTASGFHSLYLNTTGSENTASGYRSLYGNTTGYFNCAYGLLSMQLNTIGFGNTAVGVYSLRTNTTGEQNTSIGYNSGSAITTGSYNVVIGSNYGSTIATLSNNIIISDGQGNIRIQVGSTGAVTIPGTLLLSADPAVALAAATKQYVDNAIASAQPFTPLFLIGL